MPVRCSHLLLLLIEHSDQIDCQREIHQLISGNILGILPAMAIALVAYPLGMPRQPDPKFRATTVLENC